MLDGLVSTPFTHCMLSVIILNAVILNVAAPFCNIASGLPDQMGMSPLSPTPMPMSSSSAVIHNRPMSAMSQPTATMLQGSQGYHLPPGAMPLPGMASSGYSSAQQHQTSATYTPNGYLNGPVSQSSPRMLNNADGYYYNQY